ncbi:MAG: hypothetical protein IPJ65_36760 [Archangiaceae bacterium]|nr:hypothetical protein [Archangiaceae bacterium]
MVTGELPLRFEDVMMDGRVRLELIANSVGLAWREELMHHPLTPWARSQGIIPISTRFVIDGTPGPFSVDGPVTARARWEIMRTEAPLRFLLVIRCDVEAPLGRTHLPPPDDAGQVRPLGTLVAEHVFTRPFAAAEERRVTELSDYGQTARVTEWADPRALLELPAGAEALGPLQADPCEHLFGLMHTDSNQHVNSLVYPRLFEEAAVRRLGRGDLLARHLDVRFRKPSFAGDRAQLLLLPYRRGGRLGALGAFVEPGAEAASGRVFLRLELD